MFPHLASNKSRSYRRSRKVGECPAELTIVEQAELEAMYAQFKCLAASDYPSDPWKICGAIDRPTYDACLAPTIVVPNLICDRVFAFYDSNEDGLIGFEEFVRGLKILSRPKKEKIAYIFAGYDMDRDGLVSREDLKRIFRAFFSLSRDLVRDLVRSMEEEVTTSGLMHNILTGAQPTSSAFSAPIPRAIHRPRKDGSLMHVVEEENQDYEFGEEEGEVNIGQDEEMTNHNGTPPIHDPEGTLNRDSSLAAEYEDIESAAAFEDLVSAGIEELIDKIFEERRDKTVLTVEDFDQITETYGGFLGSWMDVAGL